MKRGIQILLVVASFLGIGASAYFIRESAKFYSQLPPSVLKETHAEASKGHGGGGGHGGEHGAPAGEHGGGEHGAPPAEHGGGHAAAEKPAEGHGGGEHGAPPPAEHGGGEHGAPPAEHGGGHGEPARAVASAPSLPLVSMDEVFANISTEENNHTLAIKLELELFNESERKTIETYQSGLKDAIIQASREQSYERLGSVAGKLYFKEFLVSRANTFLKKPVIRDIHFSSFFLQ